jgi:hypothetical protein
VPTHSFLPPAPGPRQRTAAYGDENSWALVMIFLQVKAVGWVAVGVRTAVGWRLDGGRTSVQGHTEGPMTWHLWTVGARAPTVHKHACMPIARECTSITQLPHPPN